MKIFGGDMVTSVYNRLGADENLPLQLGMLSKAVESAQKRVEGKNFSIRKHVLQYDDVMNSQREIIYGERKQVLDGENLKDKIQNMVDFVVETIATSYLTPEGELNREALIEEATTTLGIVDAKELLQDATPETATEILKEKAHQVYEEKEVEFGEEDMRELERVVMLKIVDQRWMDHIDSMDELKDGIGLRAYGQKDPVVQYRLEGFDMFDQMVNDIKFDVVRFMLNARKREGGVERTETVKVTNAALEDTAINLVDGNISEKEGGMKKTVVNTEPKVGRNDPCPCGSGKKYKNCCGK